jgi:hypothetical protein
VPESQGPGAQHGKPSLPYLGRIRLLLVFEALDAAAVLGLDSEELLEVRLDGGKAADGVHSQVIDALVEHGEAAGVHEQGDYGGHHGGAGADGGGKHVGIHACLLDCSRFTGGGSGGATTAQYEDAVSAGARSARAFRLTADNGYYVNF